MFDSDLLDKLSRVHPAVPPILFVPVIVVLLVEGFLHGAGALTAVWILCGYLFWTLTEYWLHRIVFHFEPEDGIGARLHWIIHGVHHDHPNDPMRLVMPPSVSIPLAAVVRVRLLARARQPDVPALRRRLPRRLSGLRHAALPRAPSPAEDPALGRRLRELHMRHHFQNHERGYGVSAPFWDHVFGTAPTKKR